MKRLTVNSKDILHNLDVIRGICPDKRIIAVLKGNGYGLGIVPFAKLLCENGVDFFAVSGIDEAVTLREAGVETDILLLSSTSLPEEAKLIAKHSIIATVGSEEAARVLSETGVQCRAHIKAETGFGRFGFTNSADVPVFDNIVYEGVYSHFSDAFGKKTENSKAQFDKFTAFVDGLNSRGINPTIRHMCNSCGLLRFGYAHLDAVRTGSALLGRLPIPNTYGFKKVGVFESNISEIKLLPKGHNIGYANTYTTTRETKIAVVTAGYTDGIFTQKSSDTFRFADILRYVLNVLRSFNSKLTVDLGGKSVRVLGRVGMYNLILDVTDVDAKIGDIVRINCNPILVDSNIERVFI